MNEVGKIGIEEEGADEYVPRGTRGEEDDACTRDSVRDVPRGDSDLRYNKFVNLSAFPGRGRDSRIDFAANAQQVLRIVLCWFRARSRPLGDRA